VVYRRNTGASTLIVGVYVDDLVITGSDRSVIDVLKEVMKRMFAMSDLGLLSYYLGIEVDHRDDCIIHCPPSPRSCKELAWPVATPRTRRWRVGSS
jgi:hypothetical protein